MIRMDKKVSVAQSSALCKVWVMEPGRVDDGKSLFVGTGLEFAPTRDGQLFFTVNDWECEDNSGEFSLIIVMN